LPINTPFMASAWYVEGVVDVKAEGGWRGTAGRAADARVNLARAGGRPIAGPAWPGEAADALI